VLTQRFAYDLVVVDDALRRHRGRGTRVDDYHCHGLPIVAAAAGRVVEVEQSIGTAPFLGRGVADFLARGFRGNYVVIEHAEDEFAVYAHLVAGSVPLTVGEEVRRGQLVGRCGHTGHSSEPHLHFHLQNRADFFTAAGLPIRFHEAVVDGDPVRSSYLRLGARVAPRG
jgi:murein DD-endopeptidase MepM/ murein hydrolase activator NlpD